MSRPLLLSSYSLATFVFCGSFTEGRGSGSNAAALWSLGDTVLLNPRFCFDQIALSSWKPITDYIDQQFEQYFRDESGLNRKNIQDNRVHCCLYFISPFGHG